MGNSDYVHVPSCKTPDDYDFWLAYVAPDDEILEGVDVPKTATKIRVMPFEGLHIPYYTLYHGDDLRLISPIDLALLKADGRVYFNSEDDQKKFDKELSESLAEYSRIMGKLKRAANCARFVCIVGGVVAAGVLAMRAFRKRK